MSRSIPTVVLALGVLLLSLVSASAAEVAPESVRIGVLAKRGVERCLEKWGPTAAYLTQEIPAYSFTIVPLRYDEVYTAVENRKVDFILANPSFYVGLEQLYGASRIVTLKNLHMGNGYTVFGGVIFCRTDRKDIRRLTDLKGKTFMGAEETSLGGFQAAWRELKEQGIDPYSDFADLSFGGTHDAVVYAVRDGKVDAGAVRTDALERMEMEGNIRLENFHIIHEHGGPKVHVPFLHSTRLYPEWPMAKVKRTSNELAEKVAAALLNMSPDSEAARAARCAGWTVPHNYQPVHECLEYLGVGPYKDYDIVTFQDILRRYWPWLLGVVTLLLTLVTIFALHTSRLNRRLRESMGEQRRELAERKRAEEQLRESEKRFHDVAMSSADWIWEVDKEGKYTFASGNVRQILGYSPEEIIGKIPFDLMPEEEADRVSRVFAEIAAAKKPLRDLENWNLTKQGGRVCLLTSGVPFYDSNGEFAGYRGVDRDITERKRAEEKLRESEERFRAIFETAQDSIFIKDRMLRYRHVNASMERLFGLPASSLLGQTDEELFGKEAGAHIREVDTRVLHGEIIEEEHTKQVKGIPYTFHVVKVPMRDSSGEITGLCGIARDITERKQAEKELKKLSAAVNQSSNMVCITDPDGVIEYVNPRFTEVTGYSLPDVVGKPVSVLKSGRHSREF